MPDAIIGGSPALRRILAALPRLASDQRPIVLIGEAGVGKSLLAAHIHSLSSFRSSQIEVVNLSLLSDRDQRVALFGGGPPELTTTRRSCLELPTTLIIKHVDHASPYLQEKLAQSLISRKVVRPGFDEPHPVSARLIFTLRSSVPALLRKRRLHPLLSNILTAAKRVTIPPLRKRRDDIPPLAEHFLQRFPSPIPPSFSLGLKRTILNHNWPGNITELKAFLRSLVIPPPSRALLDRERIELSKILNSVEEGREISLRDAMSSIESAIIDRALEKTGGHQDKAAQLLGLTARSIRRKIRLP